MNDSFTGVIYVTDENERWYWMNEAIELKIPIKKYLSIFVKIIKLKYLLLKQIWIGKCWK